MIYTITESRGDRFYKFETVYPENAAEIAMKCAVDIYADGVKVDFADLVNFAFDLHSDYPETMTEADAEYNIKCWTEEGAELPEGITAGLLAAVFNKI